MYRKTNESIWTGRSDKEEGAAGKRWHEVVHMIDLENRNLPQLKEDHQGIVLLGFKCDEGVRRNNGRPGAADGPDATRKILAVLPVHFKDNTVLFDGGDVYCEDGQLEAAQEKLTQLIVKVLNKGYFPFILGGGHEMAWGTFRGIANSENAPGKTGIVNLDAHFDLRKPSQAGASSGTPFYQIASWHQSQDKPFRYFVAGIQRVSNTRALFERARQLGTEYITAWEIRQKPEDAYKKLNDFVKSVDHIYFTICLDVFNSAFVPGVSAPNSLGIQSFEAIELIHIIKDSKKLVAADIAEMNPVFDEDNRTARLSAALAFELLLD